MSRATLFDTWHIGRNLNYQALVDACLDFAARNLDWLTQREEFWQMSKEEVHGILQHECFKSCGKQQLDAIEKWYELKRDPDPTVNDFKKLLGIVNWTAMTENDLMLTMVSLDDKELK